MSVKLNVGMLRNLDRSLVGVMDLSCQTFDAISHTRFSHLSGDYNPIHMDPIAARRTQAGAPIVHGVHSLLRLLEVISSLDTRLPKPTGLRVQFRKPIYVGEEGIVEVKQLTPQAVRSRIVVDGTEAVVVSVRFGMQCRQAPLVKHEKTVPTMPPASPNNLRFEEMSGRTGCLSFTSALAGLQEMFPSAARFIGASQIAALACSSCVVGMVVPGLHSLIVGLKVSFFDGCAVPADALQFTVVSVEPRYRLVHIEIEGGGLHGSLETVGRLPPVTQPSIARVRTAVARNEFLGSSALIVGGSRGLGELTAKLIAAGGGRVVITYASGKTDAASVSGEIRMTGADCITAAYDVRRSAAEQLPAVGELVPAQIYYFATPPIFRRKADLFDSSRFAEFNLFYLAGFLDLVKACLSRRPDGITVFYPSSVAVEDRPPDMTEYAMSKAAAEVLCADMRLWLPNLRLLTHRLPRLLTDQTSSVMQVETVDPIEVMLPIVREMHGIA